jgi:hypothetical protein
MVGWHFVKLESAIELMKQEERAWKLDGQVYAEILFG